MVWLANERVRNFVTRGRQPNHLGVHSFEHNTLLLPDAATLDTSFVVNALLPNETLHAQCSSYLQRLAQHGTTVYFNRLLEIELAEAAVKLALIEKHGRPNWRSARLDGRLQV